jgi:hypothetical protein
VRHNREAEARPRFQKALEIKPQFEEAKAISGGDTREPAATVITESRLEKACR